MMQAKAPQRTLPQSFRWESYVVASERPASPPQRPERTVSVVIATLNNQETLGLCLDSMFAQECAPYEVIVVDGHSTDRTVEIAESKGARVVYDDRNYGSACNKGVESSQGEVVALFDSDIVIPHDKWLCGAIQLFDTFPSASTIYPTQRPPPGSARLTRFYLDHWLSITESRMRRHVGYFGGGNCLFLKHALEEAGNFNQALHWGADFDMARRLCQRGYSVVMYQDPIWHDTMRSFREFAGKQKAMTRTLSASGFELMGLSTSDALYEQLVLGVATFLRELAGRDTACLAYPPYIAIRVGIYGSNLFRKLRAQ